TVTITPTALGQADNNISVSANEDDADPSNNSTDFVMLVSTNAQSTNVLVGAFQNVSTKCKTKKHEQIDCKVSGAFTLVNPTTNPLASADIKLYLSDDTSLNEGDLLVKQFKTGKIKPVSQKTKKFKGSCKKCGGTVIGKFLIGIVNSDTNN